MMHALEQEKVAAIGSGILLGPLNEAAVRGIVSRATTLRTVVTMAERIGHAVKVTSEALAHAARMYTLSRGRRDSSVGGRLDGDRDSVGAAPPLPGGRGG